MRKEPTTGERLLWQHLHSGQLGVKFRRQHPIGPFIVDFYAPDANLVVEVDGDSHADNGQAEYDNKRDVYLQMLGLQVIRYPDRAVKSNIENVLEDIVKLLPTPPPASEL
ncbi:endonuclease domain-containing protein [bacterium]|nr:endonuclease domain-containing protein [bacterium]MBU1937234.1 endonuclease domain-containing protein [bacterium]